MHVDDQTWLGHLRDRLIHGYFDVNLDIVWQTVAEDLPGLVVRLEEIIRS